MPNLNALAREFFLSESTLKRQFKRSYGQAIYEYYLDKKMELAKRMLSEHRRSIAQVSFALGYENTGSFIKTFKKYYGMSPGLLRSEKEVEF